MGLTTHASKEYRSYIKIYIYMLRYLSMYHIVIFQGVFCPNLQRVLGPNDKSLWMVGQPTAVQKTQTTLKGRKQQMF